MISAQQQSKLFFDYLRKLRARTLETFKGEIIEHRSDGNYNVRNFRTGGTFIAAPASGSDTLAAGQLVTITRPDGSGRSSGGEYSIVGVQTTNILTSSTVRFSDSQTTTAEALSRLMLTGVEVSYVTIGTSTALVVDAYGTNLTVAPTYGDPSIGNLFAAAFTGTSSVKFFPQTAATPVGVYSLTVGGVTIPDFFRVV